MPGERSNMLVAALGSYGDVYPMVGIASTLQQRGHRVTLFTHAHFEDLARQQGLDVVCLDTAEDYHRFANHPDLFDSRKGFAVFMQNVVLPNIRTAYNALVAYIQPRRTVMIAPMTVFAARLVQEKYGTPLVTIHTIPMAIKSAYEIPKVAGRTLPDWSPIWLRAFYWWVADKVVVDPLICPSLNAFRNELGLPPVNRIITRWVHSPQKVICMFPDWFAAPQPDWPPNTVTTGFPLFDEGDEQPLADDIEKFLADGSPPVVFMPGSLMQQGYQFFSESMKACQILGCRGIFLSRYAEHIPENLPDNIQHFAYIPFSRLLPHSAVLVHHGGIGTTAQALRAGVPQLIHPLAYDQYDNAARLHNLGVGTSVKPVEYLARMVAGKLDTLMTAPEVKKACQETASRFLNHNPLDATCAGIEELD